MRPPAALALVEQPGSHSMPSGHALIVVVFFGLLAYALFRWIDAGAVAPESAPRWLPSGLSR